MVLGGGWGVDEALTATCPAQHVLQANTVIGGLAIRPCRNTPKVPSPARFPGRIRHRDAVDDLHHVCMAAEDNIIRWGGEREVIVQWPEASRDRRCRQLNSQAVVARTRNQGVAGRLRTEKGGGRNTTRRNKLDYPAYQGVQRPPKRWQVG